MWQCKGNSLSILQREYRLNSLFYQVLYTIEMQDWSNSYLFRVQHWQNITVTACLEMPFPHFHSCAQPLLQLTQQILTHPPGTPVGQHANSFLLKTSLDYLLKISLDISWFSTQHSRMKINAENCTKEDNFYLQKKNVAYLKVYLLIFMRHVLSKRKSPSRGPRKAERDPRTNICPWISNTECFAVSI